MTELLHEVDQSKLRVRPATETTIDQALGIQYELEVVAALCSKADISGYGVNYYGGTSITGLLVVKRGEDIDPGSGRKNDYYQVGIIRKDSIIPDIWFEGGRFANREDVAPYLQQVHRDTQLLTHPAQEKIEGIKYPEEFGALHKMLDGNSYLVKTY